MASRFRGTRTAAPAVPEVEADIIKPSQWPHSLSHADRLNEADTKEGPPPVASRVEASFFTALNYGNRHDNEDRPVISRDTMKSGSDFHIIGVLDGHDTADASEMVSKELPKVLSKKLKDGFPIDQAYVTALAEIEERLKRNPHPSAGTCVVNCLHAGRFVWCANLGDCRAGLIFLQTATELADPKKAAGPVITGLTWLSRDHKASSPWERERIKAAGGTVIDGRVEGLEPSRTLGDFDVKQQVRKDVISINPDIRRAEIGNGTAPAQAVLVCATDGIWDVLTGQDICNLITVRKELGVLQAASLSEVCGGGSAPPPSSAMKAVLTEVAEDFVQFSVSKGSRDDCTAVVALITVAPSR